jgi:hypothetical protein
VSPSVAFAARTVPAAPLVIAAVPTSLDCTAVVVAAPAMVGAPTIIKVGRIATDTMKSAILAEPARFFIVSDLSTNS